ncbi:enoyl-CoA hydratase/isomerase family protein [Novosphingobium sp. KCTC 2891]|uniref:enoyl-CoA hydratase/isomerase family protein n=1 Tax=Novosphingobium sp. KCTC 2891 TaxID=2989730 RepID=UPI0022214E73|nr:enoyl-CoA hydratase/isomerase family protein [Novosphingobium sp. KCTC 2891]MCW1383634.1 enoyl-CoA hydratase/isomerase family protein [Novosphingobium sp. KCTC 2891]
MTEKVLYEVDQGVGIITLNRPDVHNAMDDETAALYKQAVHAALDDPAVRAILLRGAGKSFCSGRDTTVLGHRARDESDYHFVLRHQQSRLEVLDSPKPFIAALKGAVIGGGCEIALSCDIRVCSTDLKMALPEIHYGILPDTGGTQLLTTLIGPARTKYMVMTGERIDAQTAMEWGAVDFVVAPDDLDAKALDVARKIAAKPPICLAMAKTMIDQAHAGAVRNGIAQELLAQTALFKTEDYIEARAAIREKRKPVYKGK